MFLSTFEKQLDSKRRIVVPAEFRALAAEPLGGVFCFPAIEPDCIEGGGQARFQRYHSLIEEFPSGDPPPSPPSDPADGQPRDPQAPRPPSGEAPTGAAQPQGGGQGGVGTTTNPPTDEPDREDAANLEFARKQTDPVLERRVVARRARGHADVAGGMVAAAFARDVS